VEIHIFQRLNTFKIRQNVGGENRKTNQSKKNIYPPDEGRQEIYEISVCSGARGIPETDFFN